MWVNIQEFKCACGANDWRISDISNALNMFSLFQMKFVGYSNLVHIRSGLWLFISFASHIAFLHYVAVLFFLSAWVAHRCKNGRLLE